jgi:hypothetical protein
MQKSTPHMENLGAALEARRRPFAIEIRPGGIGAGVPAPRAVRVHVRDDVEHRALEQAAHDRVVLVDEAIDEGFDEVSALHLRGMLARDQPALALAGRGRADDEHVDFGAVEAAAHGLDAHARR